MLNFCRHVASTVEQYCPTQATQRLGSSGVKHSDDRPLAMDDPKSEPRNNMLVQRPYRDDNTKDEEAYGLDVPSTRSRNSIEMEDEIIQTPLDRRRRFIKYGAIAGGLVLLVMIMSSVMVGDRGVFGGSSEVEGFHSRQELRHGLSEYLTGDQKAIVSRYGPIEMWNVRGVADFTQLFDARRLPELEDFDEDISQWDLSNAKLCTGMFYGNKKFDQDLQYWNVSGVTHFNAMFRDCAAFTGKGLRYWDVSEGIYFHEMFMGATEFAEHIDDWNVEKATDTHEMFMNAKNFNADLGRWKLSSTKSCAFMFHGAESFGANLCDWQDNLLRAAKVDSMFELSGCPIEEDPIIWYRFHGLSNRSHFCTDCPQLP